MQTKKNTIYGKNPGLKMIVTLDYIIGMVYCEEHERYDINVFLGFLENILYKYLMGKIIMILDNAGIHHAKLIQSFLKKVKDRLESMFYHHRAQNLIEGGYGAG
nr:transposase [uncultured Romboutsia sp.]